MTNSTLIKDIIDFLKQSLYHICWIVGLSIIWLIVSSISYWMDNEIPFDWILPGWAGSITAYFISRHRIYKLRRMFSLRKSKYTEQGQRGSTNIPDDVINKLNLLLNRETCKLDGTQKLLGNCLCSIHEILGGEDTFHKPNIFNIVDMLRKR